jgi:hypothetical protein
MKCFIAAGLLSATLLLGCSDETEPVPPIADAQADIAVTDSGVRADISADSPTNDGPFDLFDVFPLGDAGCPACIRDRCGAQINACINNPACATGLVCTLQMCAGGLLGGEGGYTPADFLCVLGCFNGDQATALLAIGSLTCVTMTCGGSCSLGDAAVIDVRPPDASADTASEGGAGDGAVGDGGVDANAPETGSTPDASDNADADAGVPGIDASADADLGDSASNDAGSEPADAVDAGSSMDTTPDFGPRAEDSAAD